MTRPLGVGVLGLGFMGRQHVAAYAAAAAAGHSNRLVAVCDPDPERRAGKVPAQGNAELDGAGDERLFDPDEVAGYERPEQLLADPAVELVSICTYTDSHVELGLAALAAGKHVLVEKPVALQAESIERLAAAARKARGQLCMPAMCIRFWPGWRWLRDAVAAGELGAVRTASIRRVGPAPAWGRAFYGDATRTGGALVDLHIHDADFVRWCFGPPAAVHARGDVDHVTTSYRYADGLQVVAEGGWVPDADAAFFMGFRVEGERGVADYAFGRQPVLRLERGGEVRPVSLPDGTGYDGEVRHLLDAIAAGRTRLDATLEEAAVLTAMLHVERRSLELGRELDLDD